MTDIVIRQMFGLKAAVLLPDIPDGAPDPVREGIARRRLVMTTGACPCGAVMTGPNRAQRRQIIRDRRHHDTQAWQVDIQHDNDCPAVDDKLYPAIEAWRGGAA